MFDTLPDRRARAVRSRRCTAVFTLTRALTGAAWASSGLGLSPAPPGAGRFQTAATAHTQGLPRADALADVDQFFAAYEADHPAPYAVVPRDSVRRLRAALAAALPDTLDAVDLWRRLAPVVGALGDGHTALGPPRGALQAARAAGVPGPVPLAFAIDADDALLVHHATTADAAALVPRGARVLRVNGRSMDSLYAEETATYGGGLRYRHYAAARGLAYHLWLRGVRAPYALELVDSAGAPVRRVALPPADVSSLVAASDSAAAAVLGPRVQRAHLKARVLPGRDSAGGRVGYVNFFSFEALRGPEIEDEVRAALAPLAADSVRTLVVDLRYNGGGSSAPAEVLLAHVTDRKYRFQAGWALRVSEDTRARFCGGGRWLRPVCEGPAGRLYQFPTIPEQSRPTAEPFFRGPVCVLIGPATFSAAAYAADAIRTYHLATLVGEETGGRANDWTGVVHLALAHSELPFQVSTEHTVRASGDRRDTRGVLPHVTVVPTADDVRAGRDPVLERAAHDCPAKPPR